MNEKAPAARALAKKQINNKMIFTPNSAFYEEKKKVRAARALANK